MMKDMFIIPIVNCEYIDMKKVFETPYLVVPAKQNPTPPAWTTTTPYLRDAYRYQVVGRTPDQVVSPTDVMAAVHDGIETDLTGAPPGPALQMVVVFGYPLVTKVTPFTTGAVTGTLTTHALHMRPAIGDSGAGPWRAVTTLETQQPADAPKDGAAPAAAAQDHTEFVHLIHGTGPVRARSVLASVMALNTTYDAATELCTLDTPVDRLAELVAVLIDKTAEANVYWNNAVTAFPRIVTQWLDQLIAAEADKLGKQLG